MVQPGALRRLAYPYEQGAHARCGDDHQIVVRSGSNESGIASRRQGNDSHAARRVGEAEQHVTRLAGRCAVEIFRDQDVSRIRQPGLTPSAPAARCPGVDEAPASPHLAGREKQLTRASARTYRRRSADPYWEGPRPWLSRSPGIARDQPGAGPSSKDLPRRRRRQNGEPTRGSGPVPPTPTASPESTRNRCMYDAIDIDAHHGLWGGLNVLGRFGVHEPRVGADER